MEQKDSKRPINPREKIVSLSLIFILLLVGGLIGHFVFPKEEVVYQNAQYGTFNYSDLRIYVNERTGDLSIYGLRPGNLWVANVDGLSMWPAIKNNSTVIMEEVQYQDEIKVGDVVAFDFVYEDGWKYVVHRVIEIGTDEEGWYALTEGDNKDEPIMSHKCRRDEIWGRVRIYIDY